jgi:hypothetical protein
MSANSCKCVSCKLNALLHMKIVISCVVFVLIYNDELHQPSALEFIPMCCTKEELVSILYWGFEMRL